MTEESVRKEISSLSSQRAGLVESMKTPGISGTEARALSRAVQNLTAQIEARQTILTDIQKGYSEQQSREIASAQLERRASAQIRKQEVVKLKEKGYVEKKGLLYSPGGAVTTKAGARVGFLSPYQEASPFYKGKYPVPKAPAAPTITPTVVAAPDITVKTPEFPGMVTLGIGSPEDYFKTKDYGTTGVAGPSVVSVSKDFDIAPADLYKDLSWWEKTKLTGRKYTDIDFWRDVGQQVTGTGEYQKPSIFKGVEKVFTPLQIFAQERKGEIKSPDIGYSGTGILDVKTKQYDIPAYAKGKTGWQRRQEDIILKPYLKMPAEAIAYQAGKEVETTLLPGYETKVKGIAAGYQAQVEKGLDITKAQTGLEADVAALQTQYETEATAKYETLAGTRLREKALFTKEYLKASEFKVDVPKAFATTTIIAGSFVAPVLTAGAVSFEGIGTTYEGASEKDYLKMAAGVGMVGLGTYVGTSIIGKQITQAQIEGVLGIKPRIIKGARIKGPITKDIFVSMQETPSAAAISKSVVYSKAIGGKIKVFGTTQRVLGTREFMTQDPLLFVTKQQITGTGFGIPVGQAGLKGTFALSQLKTTTPWDFALRAGKKGLSGKLIIDIAPKPTYSYVGGVSTKTTIGGQEFVKGWSGRVSQMEFLKFKGFVGADFKFPAGVEDVSLLKIVSGKGVADAGTSFYLGGAGKGVTGLAGPSLKGVTVPIQTALPKVSTAVSTIQKSVLSSATATSGIVGGRQVVDYSKLGKELTTAPAFVSLTPTKLITVQKPKAIVAPAFLAPQSFAGLETRTKTRVATVPALIQPQIQFPGLKQRAVQIQIPALTALGPPAFAPSWSGLPIPKIPIIPPFFKGFGIEGQLGKAFRTGKQFTRYTPSFAALKFKIFGPKPKGIETGLRLRPITPGFKWSNLIFGKRRKKRKKK